MPPPTPTPTHNQSILPTSFTRRKAQILSQLSVPFDAYEDASPKGSVDEGIRGLIDGLNARDGWCTTSSCAGRVAVFVEGVRGRARTGKGSEGIYSGDEVKIDGKRPGDEEEEEEEEDVRGAGEEDSENEDGHVEDGRDLGESGGMGREMVKLAVAGGKGGGGRWLFVSHEPVVMNAVNGKDWSSFLGMQRMGEAKESGRQFTEERLIHFKFEPMSLEELAMSTIFASARRYHTRLVNASQILHVLTASLSHAQAILKAALQAGFRESGALNLISSSSEAPTPMVAVRSTGLALDSVIGRLGTDGEAISIVSDAYLKGLLAVANVRFEENSRRTIRFQDLLNGSTSIPTDIESGKKTRGRDWEDATARRERERAEGLKKSRELRGGQSGEGV